MTVDNNNLIWIDLEMTGLDTVNDLIIEIATIVTDKDLNILAKGPMIAIHQSDEIIVDGGAALSASDSHGTSVPS